MKNHTTGYEEEMHVSNIELFFDLVLVFSITQLTHLVELAQDPLDFLLALLVLMLIWWMYASYAWLANEADTQRPMRLMLFAAMAGFLVIALSIPRIFGADGLAFGFAYLFVIVLHLVAFLIKGGHSARRAMLGIAPFNLSAAALVIAAGLIHAAWNWLFFLAAVILLAISTAFHREQGFWISPTHFAERHGLIIIIALGESVVAIGTGAADRTRDQLTIAAIVLSLVLIAALWWSYFDHDDERAEHTLISASPEARSRLGLLGYWYTHLAMIAGIVMIATGVKEVIANGVGPIHGAAWLLAGGIAFYLLGDVVFRWVMGIRPVIVRALGAAIALTLGVIGPLWGSEASLGTAAALVIVLLVIEQGLERGKNQSKL
jgi:low temperature requirement protein LtrA